MQEKEKNIAYVSSILFLTLVMMLFLFVQEGTFVSLVRAINRQPAAAALTLSSPFHYRFSVDGVLEEASRSLLSSSPYWWLNSGGRFILKDGKGSTLQGSLSSTNKWRLAYLLSSPSDTDNGYHPQNIFRLITRSSWDNIQQDIDFNITQEHLSDSPNRNESNGVLLFSRYKDSNNLYYTGVRVDGAVVIKKKYQGIYYTLGYAPFFGSGYDRQSRPSLLPKNTWMSLRSEIVTLENNNVSIRVYLRKDLLSPWDMVLSVVDDGSFDHTPPIVGSGNAGIRTDFMDVVFDDYKIVTINE